MNVALAAMGLGLLVRGGLTIGPLAHRGAVVYGPAMIEAYRLESRTAVFPRIVVAASVYEDRPDDLSISTDYDGLQYLDYVKVLAQVDPGKNAMPGFEGAFQRKVEVVDGQVRKLEAERNYDALSKWAWLQKKLSEIRVTASKA